MPNAENAPDKNRVCVLPPVRCTADERDHIKERAAAAGTSQSAYIRTMALSGRMVVKSSSVDASLIFQLQGIGKNLNQITKAVHVTGELPTALPVTLARINALLDALIPE